MDDEKLIEIVEMYPFLYDKKDEKYKLIDARRAAWQEIGNRLQVDGDVAMKRWNNLREQFSKEIRNHYKPSRSGSSKTRHWALCDRLGFLKSHIIPRSMRQSARSLSRDSVVEVLTPTSPDSDLHAPDNQPDKKKVKRRKWCKDDNMELLQIWETHHYELRQCKRNSHIYAKMSEEMGGRFTAQEIHTKITNFTQKYRSEKKLVGPSGGSPSTWAYYEAVHKIIGSNAANNTTVLESFIVFDSNSSFAESVSSPVLTTNPLPSPSESYSVEFTPMPTSPLSPDDEPSTSSSARKRKYNENSEIVKIMNSLAQNSEEQTEIMRKVAADHHNLCICVQDFLESQKESEQSFINIVMDLMKKD